MIKLIILSLIAFQLTHALNILKVNQTSNQTTTTGNTTIRNRRQQSSNIIELFCLNFTLFLLLFLAACYSNPCNSGTCYDLQVNILPHGGFYCVCPNGFTGIQCEKG